MRLDLHYTDGTTRRVTVLDHRKLTLGDWRRLTPMVEEDILDATYARVSIFTGIPVDELSARVSVKGIGQIMEVVWGELGKAIALSGAFKADMAGTDDVPKPPRRIIIGGKKYRVPHDVEVECTFGQFVDWEAWRAPEHEADLCAEALAFMLVEEGKQYGGTDAAKVEAMRSATIADAFSMCVFFFARSPEFQRVTALRYQAFHTRIQQAHTRTAKSSAHDIEVSEH